MNAPIRSKVALQMRLLDLNEKQQTRAAEELGEQVAQFRRESGAHTDHLTERLVVLARVHCKLRVRVPCEYL